MTVLLDAAGRRRSPVTISGYHAGRPSGNKGMRYPADPPTVDEIVAVMRHTGDDGHGWRLRAMIVGCGVRGCGCRKRSRSRSPTSPRAAARCWSAAARAAAAARSAWMTGAGTAAPLAGRARRAARRAVVLHHRRPHPRPRLDGRRRSQRVPSRRGRAGVRRRFPPHRLRHAHALELAREGVPLNIIQGRLGHTNLGTTSIYLQGIDPEEIIATVHARRPPMMSASAGLNF